MIKGIKTKILSILIIMIMIMSMTMPIFAVVTEQGNTRPAVPGQSQATSPEDDPEVPPDEEEEELPEDAVIYQIAIVSMDDKISLSNSNIVVRNAKSQVVRPQEESGAYNLINGTYTIAITKEGYDELDLKAILSDTGIKMAIVLGEEEFEDVEIARGSVSGDSGEILAQLVDSKLKEEIDEILKKINEIAVETAGNAQDLPTIIETAEKYVEELKRQTSKPEAAKYKTYADSAVLLLSEIKDLHLKDLQDAEKNTKDIETEAVEATKDYKRILKPEKLEEILEGLKALLGQAEEEGTKSKEAYKEGKRKAELIGSLFGLVMANLIADMDEDYVRRYEFTPEGDVERSEYVNAMKSSYGNKTIYFVGNIYDKKGNVIWNSDGKMHRITTDATGLIANGGPSGYICYSYTDISISGKLDGLHYVKLEDCLGYYKRIDLDLKKMTFKYRGSKINLQIEVGLEQSMTGKVKLSLQWYDKNDSTRFIPIFEFDLGGKLIMGSGGFGFGLTTEYTFYIQGKTVKFKLGADTTISTSGVLSILPEIEIFGNKIPLNAFSLDLKTLVTEGLNMAKAVGSTLIPALMSSGGDPAAVMAAIGAAALNPAVSGFLMNAAQAILSAFMNMFGFGGGGGLGDLFGGLGGLFGGGTTTTDKNYTIKLMKESTDVIGSTYTLKLPYKDMATLKAKINEGDKGHDEVCLKITLNGANAADVYYIEVLDPSSSAGGARLNYAAYRQRSGGSQSNTFTINYINGSAVSKVTKSNVALSYTIDEMVSAAQSANATKVKAIIAAVENTLSASEKTTVKNIGSNAFLTISNGNKTASISLDTYK